MISLKHCALLKEQANANLFLHAKDNDDKILNKYKDPNELTKLVNLIDVKVNDSSLDKKYTPNIIYTLKVLFLRSDIRTLSYLGKHLRQIFHTANSNIIYNLHKYHLKVNKQPYPFLMYAKIVYELNLLRRMTINFLQKQYIIVSKNNQALAKKSNNEFKLYANQDPFANWLFGVCSQGLKQPDLVLIAIRMLNYTIAPYNFSQSSGILTGKTQQYNAKNKLMLQVNAAATNL